MSGWPKAFAAGLGLLTALVWLAAPVGRAPMAQHRPEHGTPAADRSAGTGARMTMDELHRAGGVPPGWRFSWPAGDATKGRDVFARLECYQCHEVKGDSFPPVTPDPSRRGPGLAGMGDHHPAEYFAEAILNPNAVVVTGPGHTGPDGRSIMPDYRDSLTLAETIDLVAYIRSLRGGDHAHHPAGAERERVGGPYRVRIDYATGGAGHAHHHHHHHGQHQHGGGTGPGAHLMVFVSDAALGEPVPYLPVIARIHTGAAAPRVVKLNPMLGARGFHYGADVTVPDGTTRIVVAIGKPTVALMPATADRFARGAEVSFDWGK
jgi:hypothetical protein